MAETLELIRELSDAQVIAATSELYSRVFTEVPGSEVRNNATNDSGVAFLLKVDRTTLRKELSTDNSARLGRQLLELYACDKTLEPFVYQAIMEVRNSDNMILPEMLIIGAVINLTMLMATTEIKIEKRADGKLVWQFTKKQAPPDLVKGIIDSISGVVKTMTSL